MPFETCEGSGLAVQPVHENTGCHAPDGAYEIWLPVTGSPKVSSIVTLTRVARTGGKPAMGKVEIQRETSERTSRGKSIAEN